MGKVSNRRAENTFLIMCRCRVDANHCSWVQAWKIGGENFGLSSPLRAERRESSSSVVLHYFGAIENIGARVHPVLPHNFDANQRDGDLILCHRGNRMGFPPGIFHREGLASGVIDKFD
jgi:hypothetical protein